MLQCFFEKSRLAISVNAEHLDPVVAFPYLGRTVAYNNSGWADLYQNLRKVQRRWAMVGELVTNMR